MPDTTPPRRSPPGPPAALAPQVARTFAPFSDLELERYLVGDADEALRARVEEAARTDARLAAHLADRRADKAAFALLHPRLPALPPLVDAGSTSRLPWLSKWRAAWGASLGALALTGAAAALVVLPRLDDPPGEVGADGAAGEVRLKSAANALAVDVLVKRAARAFVLRPGALLREGDALQLAATGAGAGYASLIVHELDTGNTSVLVDNEPARPGTDGILRLSRTVVLDGHAGPEELVLVVAPEKVLATDVVAAILAGRPPLGAGPGHVGVVRYDKEPHAP